MVTGGPPEDGTWTQVFGDDFEGEELDAEKWDIGFGWGRSTDWTQEKIVDENVVVEDSLLRLRQTNPNDGPPYHSGAVNTREKFYRERGYFEAKIRMPRGKGFLPAFWSKSNDGSWPPEIDFVEVLGKDPEVAELHVHWDEGDGRLKVGEQVPGPDYTEDFHVYGCEWMDDGVRWFIDGEQVWRTDAGIENINVGNPFYMMLSVHVGADWPGYPDEGTPWPGSMDVDWVRVWERDE